MSYYLFVTRKPDPTEDDGPEISALEWQAVVAADPALVLADPPGKKPHDQGIYAVWNGHPCGYPIWFELREGSVAVNLHAGAVGGEIDREILAKLRSFARQLKSNIVSELGEQL